MNKNEKQAIEEMARVMHEKNREIAQDCYGIEKLIAAGKSLPEAYAEALYNADYRKQSVGYWIRHKENCLYNKCSICSYEHCREDNCCPNCGARMKGGAE